MDCSPPGSYIHGIFQARILEWFAFSRGSSKTTDQICVCCFAGGYLFIWATKKPTDVIIGSQRRLSTKELMLLNCGAEDFLESLGLQGDQTSQSQRKSTLNVHWKDWCWGWSSNILTTWCEEPTLGKEQDAGQDWGQEEKGVTEDEMVGWHHRLNGHEFEQTPGNSERQGSLVCCR